MSNFYAPDLTQRPPCSMRVHLGGYAILPRMLDKCRATIMKKNGEYRYNCPLDQRFIDLTGIDPETFKAEVAKGRDDGEMLQWVTENAKQKRSPWEIAQWSDYQNHRGPDSDAETLAFFAEEVGKLTKTREDIRTWADLLDFDDYVSFGGR
jgi:hypothetical protein